MNKLLLILLLLSSIAQANLGTFKDGKFIYPNTNKPFTGNLEVINHNWGNDSVEFSKDYVGGILHGTEKSYYQSGKLKSVGKFNQGKVNGTVTGYYEDGSIQVKAYFNNGVKQGRVAYYYLNGSKQLEQFFTDDKLDGLVREWYDTGSLMISRQYSNGLLHGEVKTYYETGELFEATDFNYGTPKYKAVYRKDGSLADEQGFLNKQIIDSIIS
jgi:antitoxin component YwqK of YwqJK toxin-antitoxin module